MYANDCQDQHIVRSVERSLWHSLAATYLGAPSVVYQLHLYVLNSCLSGVVSLHMQGCNVHNYSHSGKILGFFL